MALAGPNPAAYFGRFSPRAEASPQTFLFKSLKPPPFWPWEKVKIGPMRVSPMGFGTWAWGNQLLWGYQESMDLQLQEVFNLAVENGINLFDTADSYGTGKLNGQSEKLLGKFIRDLQGHSHLQALPVSGILMLTCLSLDHGWPLNMEARKMGAPWGSSFTRESFEKLDIGPVSLVDRRCSARASFAGKQRVRDEVVIATKFAAYPWRLTPGQFVNACKGSLDRLQVDKIGVGQLHWSTANYAPLQELALWDGLVAMYEKGLVRGVGVSNYGPKQLVKIHDYLKARGVPLVSAQVQFSLISMGDEQFEIKSICDSLGIRLIAYSPLGLGMLTGKYTPTNLPSGPRALLFRQILPGLRPLLSSLEEMARRRRKTIPQVALNWCICKGTIPIPGVKTVKQAKENLGALGWRLSNDELLQLESAAMESPTRMIQNIFQTR